MTGGQNKITLWESSDYKVNVNWLYIKLVDINERVRPNRQILFCFLKILRYILNLFDEIGPMHLISLICTDKLKLPCSKYSRIYFFPTQLALHPTRVAKNRGARERGSHEVKTCRMNCDTDCKKYAGKNICSETNILNVQNKNICRCVTYIYIYILVRPKVL